MTEIATYLGTFHDKYGSYSRFKLSEPINEGGLLVVTTCLASGTAYVLDNYGEQVAKEKTTEHDFTEFPNILLNLGYVYL